MQFDSIDIAQRATCGSSVNPILFLIFMGINWSEHSSKLVKILLEAEFACRDILGNHIIHQIGGDITTLGEFEYIKNLSGFLSRENLSTIIVGEAKDPENPESEDPIIIRKHDSSGPEYIIFSDPNEGGTNRQDGTLPHGFSLGVYPYDKIQTAENWLAIIIGDRKNDVIYVAQRTSDNGREGLVYVIEKGVRREPIRRTDDYLKENGFSMEVPGGYTKKDIDGFRPELWRQVAYYNALMCGLNNTQLRSVDSTAVRSASVVDAVPALYVDWRKLDKLGYPFDFILSAILNNLSGGREEDQHTLMGQKYGVIVSGMKKSFL